MINSLALNKDWDLALDAYGNIGVLTGKNRVAQDAACACKLFLGEAIFHVDQGVPYMGEILGSAPQRAIIGEHLRRRVLTVPNVVDAEIREYEFKGRVLKAEIQITDNIAQAIAAEEAKKEQRTIDDFYSLIDVYTTENVYRIRL
jgi:hypothetical protein